MGTNRIAWSATGAGVTSSLVFAVYQFQGWTMPNWLAIPLVLVIAGAGLVFLGILISDVPRLWRWLRSQVRLQWPIARVRAPVPDQNQWLLDLASEHARAPEQYLRVTGQFYQNKDLSPDLHRPWVEVCLEILNVSVYNVHIEGIGGRCTFDGKELADEVEYTSGSTMIPHAVTGQYFFKQVIDPAAAKLLYSRIRESHTFFEMPLNTVALRIRTEGPGLAQRTWRVAGGDKWWVR